MTLEHLFRCPACKGHLERPARDAFACRPCGLHFAKEGEVFDFRITPQTGADRWDAAIAGAFATGSGWFAEVRNHFTPDQYRAILADDRINEIAEHTASLANAGVDLGERYDRELLVPDSVRDIHELSIGLRLIPPTRQHNVALDLGGGTLRATRPLLERGYDSVLVVDLLPEMMEFGLSKLPASQRERVTLVAADARLLPIADRSVDLTFSLAFFEHVDPPLILLLDVERILVPGGAAAINTWNGEGLSYRSNIKAKGRSYYANGFFYAFHGRRELEHMLSRLNVEYRVRPYGFYGGRRLAHLLGPAVLKPAIASDAALSRILPASLFPFLMLSFHGPDG